MEYAPLVVHATNLAANHFHRVPNKLFDTQVYRKPLKPLRRRRHRHGDRNRDQDEQEDQDRRSGQDDQENREDRDRGRGSHKYDDQVYDNPEIEEPDDEPGYHTEPEPDVRGIPRHSGQGRGMGGSQYRSDSPSIYSHEPPRVRPEYIPSYAPNAADNYFPPPPISPYPDPRPSFGREDYSRHREDLYDDEEEYRPRQRRPKAVTRRSSFDDLPPRRFRQEDQQMQRSETVSKSSRSERGGRDEGLRDKAHRYGVKDEVKGLFTDSPKALAGGAIGALVGGWAASKFEESQTGNNVRDHKDSHSTLITMLGAAAGGLAANAVVAKKDKQSKSDGRGDGDEDKDKRGRRNSVRSRDVGRDDRYDRDDSRRSSQRSKGQRTERDTRDNSDDRDYSRRVSMRSKGHRTERDSSLGRHLAYDEDTTRHDGMGYDGPNDGYY